MMLELIKAMSGRLIGPKTWDRIVRIFGAIWTVHGLRVDCVGCLFHDLCIKSCCDVYEAGMAIEFWVSRSGIDVG